MDHFDITLASLRERLTAAKALAGTGDFMAEYEAEALADTIAEIEFEAAEHRAKTPEQLAAEDAEREAKAEARHRAGVASGAWDEDGNALPQPDEDEEED